MRRLLVPLGVGLLGLTACSHASTPAAPTGWRIVYRVQDTAGPTPRTTTQVVEVDPPYGARTVTYAGDATSGASLGGAAWVRGHQYVTQDGGTNEVATVAPGFAGPDAHLDVALETALRLGLVRRGGSDTVAGVRCTLWTSRGPLDSDPFALPTATDTTTTCVDDRGRWLRDVWTLGGKVVRTRTAVSVGAPQGPPLAGATPTPMPAVQKPLLVKDVPAAQLATALAIGVPPAPAGLRPDGAVALLERDLYGGTGGILREGGTFTWGDGKRRLVTLELMRGLVDPQRAPTTGTPVRLASGVTVRLTPVLNGLQAELLTPAGLAVKAVGDLPEQDFLDWLGRVRWDRVAGP